MQASFTDLEESLIPETLRKHNKRWRYFTKCEKYIVSDHGDIWSFFVNRLLTPRIRNEYYVIGLFRKQNLIHRIVYMSFDPESIGLDETLVIDHIDRNKLNNHISNLRQVTKSVNSTNKVIDFKTSYTRTRESESVTFNSIKEAIEATPGSSNSGITKCCRGVRPFHMGYSWTRSKSREVQIHNPEEDDFTIIGEIDGIIYDNYEINKFGVIRKIVGDKRKIPTQFDWAGGYKGVSLNKDGKNKSYLVHRIMAMVFLKDSRKLEHTQVNHRDKKKHNNILTNLEWVTGIENMTHASGKAVRSIDLITKEEVDYISASEAGRILDLSFKSISRAARGERKTAYGKTWHYI